MQFQGYVHEAYHTATGLFCEAVCLQVFICWQREWEEILMLEAKRQDWHKTARFRGITNVCWWSCSIWSAALRYWSPCPVGTDTIGQIIPIRLRIPQTKLPAECAYRPRQLSEEILEACVDLALVQQRLKQRQFTFGFFTHITSGHVVVFRLLTSVGSSAITSSSSSLKWTEDFKLLCRLF